VWRFLALLGPSPFSRRIRRVLRGTGFGKNFRLLINICYGALSASGVSRTFYAQ
jgi:hypothetical protein